mgnify:CR=1 FL=1
MIKKARLLYLIHLILLIVMVVSYLTDYNRDIGITYILWGCSTAFLLMNDE